MARNLAKSIQNLSKSVRTPGGILISGVPLRAEINQKLSLKINQKLIRVRRSAHLLFRSALRAEILQNRFKIKQNLGAVCRTAY